MLKIWGRATSVNVQKVMWAVGEMGIAHERIDAGGRFGGLATPAYLALNPNARIPTIEDDGVVVWESNAIIRYLAARPYLVGDRFSLADIAVGVTLYRYFEMEIERPALSNLQAWHERLRERPAFRDHVMISFEELRG